MQVFHLGTSKYARQMTGEGAGLFGGRWNQKGDPCLYTSGTRSLCVLEYLANIEMEDLPPDLTITEYSVPDNLCRLIKPEALPPDWRQVPAPVSSKIFGSKLLTDPDCACFSVPSVIIPTERNYILNPNAVDFHRIKIVNTEPFEIDHRIKK